MSSHHEELDARTLKPLVGREPYIVHGKTLIRDCYGKTRMIFDVKRTIMLVIDYPLTLTSRGVYPIGLDTYNQWLVYTDTLNVSYHIQNKEREAEQAELSESFAEQELKLKAEVQQKAKEAISKFFVGDTNPLVQTSKVEQEIVSVKAGLHQTAALYTLLQQPQKENPHGDI